MQLNSQFRLDLLLSEWWGQLLEMQEIFIQEHVGQILPGTPSQDCERVFEEIFEDKLQDSIMEFNTNILKGEQDLHRVALKQMNYHAIVAEDHQKYLRQTSLPDELSPWQDR